MSNPWDLGSSSRSGDADMQGVGSSSSLLQSIYGSQASQLLSAMSSQLVIEEESEDDDGWGDDAVVRHSSGVPRSSRPKSSPASAIAARQKLQRPQTASAVSLSSTGRRQPTEKAETSNIISAVMTSCSTRHLSRPSSARPQLQSASTGNPRSHRRPASASAHNSSYSSLASSSSYRPPIQHAVQKKPSRPKSAFVTSSRSVPNISYNAMEEEPLANSRPSLKTSMSVLRTSEPEYLNFWEGKPLSERGGMVFHERKQWKRPKSDYGPRHYTRTNSAGSRKSSTSALTKVVEAWGEGEDDQDKVGVLDPSSDTRRKDFGGGHLIVDDVDFVTRDPNRVHPIGSRKVGKGRDKSEIEKGGQMSSSSKHSCRTQTHPFPTSQAKNKGKGKTGKKSNFQAKSQKLGAVGKDSDFEAKFTSDIPVHATPVGDSSSPLEQSEELKSEKKSPSVVKRVSFDSTGHKSGSEKNGGSPLNSGTIEPQKETDKRALHTLRMLRREKGDFVSQRAVKVAGKRKDTHDGDHGVTTGQGDLLKDLLSGMGDSNGDDEKNKKSKDDDDDDRYRKRDTSENKRDRDAYRSAAHSDSRYGKAIEEEDEGIDDDYFQKNEDDDKLPEIPSSTSITSSLSGTDLLNVTSGIEMDISPKCQLKLPPTIDVKEEDNPDLLPRIVSVTPPDKPTPTVPGRLKDFVQYCSYFSDDESDKEINMDWLKSRLAITKHCTRFELPLDLTKLEGLAPVDYLQTYCIIAERRAVFYSKIFKKFLKYQKEALSREDLLPALLEAQFNMENADQMKAVLKVVDIPAGMTAVPLKLFAGIAALAERMLRYSPLPSTTSVLSEYGLRREIVEDADFEALEWKLRGCIITDSLRNVFAQL